MTMLALNNPTRQQPIKNVETNEQCYTESSNNY